jgi:tryptophan synthase alpha subunit
MTTRIQETFKRQKELKQPVFIAYLTAGYPRIVDTIPCLLAIQNAGADIIELGKFINRYLP